MNEGLGELRVSQTLFFDNYHRTVVDTVYLYVEDGMIKIGRK